MNQGATPVCPVCGARFRGARECSRCGADLSVLLQILARAYRQRQAARAALVAGDLPEATRRALRAEALQGTAAGKRLALVCALLMSANCSDCAPGSSTIWSDEPTNSSERRRQFSHL